MPGLADMEELLADISNKNIIDYMREALACYNNGAYRGCIVMSYIALFDDIRAKLGELAKVNKIAKTVWQEIEKRAGNQDVFESYMMDQIQKEGLITTAEHDRLGVIRGLRNKAAHPSGIHATAEEARFIYRTVIGDFLSKQLLKTTHAVDALLERLDTTNLFPTTNMSEIKAIAADECSTLHSTAFPYLIGKLVEAGESIDTQTSSNAERFLMGLAALQSPEMRDIIRGKVFVAKSHHKEYGMLIGRLVAADAKLLENLAPEVLLRIKALLISIITTATSKAVTKLSHPTQQIGAMIKALGENVVLKDFPDLIEKVVEQYPYSSALLDKLEDAPTIAEKLVNHWKENARSSTFETANAFAAALSDIDDASEAILTDKDAFELIVGINRAADWGARRSKAVRSNHFSDAPKLVEAAKRFIDKNPKAAAAVVDKQTDYKSFAEFESDNFDANEE